LGSGMWESTESKEMMICTGMQFHWNWRYCPSDCDAVVCRGPWLQKMRKRFQNRWN